MNDLWLMFGGLAIVATAATPHVLRHRRAGRLASFPFPDHLAARLGATYPHLSEADRQRVLDGLREYFAVSILARGRRVAMPSQAVDTAWHEFILSTRAYQQYCRQALGRFLHHTPAEAMRSPTEAQDGIRRTWRIACKREGIDPASPSQLPLLFALDAQLQIPGGFTYALDCAAGMAPDRYCASHIGCGSGCGGGDGCSGDGGGCGGD